MTNPTRSASPTCACPACGSEDTYQAIGGNVCAPCGYTWTTPTADAEGESGE